MGYSKEENKEYLKAYFKTEHGVLKRLYHHMKERSIKNNWAFNFSFDEFYSWAYDNNFENLYINYFSSDFNKWKRPSIDRVNEYGIYNFSNMELTTWELNHIKMRTENKNIKSYTKNFSEYRESIQYMVIVTKGKYKHIFKNLNEVIKQFPFMSKSKIVLVIQGKRKHHHGFKFSKIDKEVIAR